MKTTPLKFLVVLSLLLAGVINSYADGSADFKYDRGAIEADFAGLSELEQLVESKNFLSLSEIKDQESLLESFSINNLASTPMIEDPLGIPGFWWGCIMGPLGILMAYVLSDNDKYQARQALTGCIVNGAVSAGIAVVYYLWILTYFSVY
ncbi:MAG: hypothetical protein K0B15_05905 [Lentimicrobium sp.]|nr:hypothetical protein [Lentimicrobium sp.]